MQRAAMPLAAGEVFEVPYPFIRDTYIDHVRGDDGNWREVKVPSWAPGTNPAAYDEAVADGMGAMILSVVSTCQMPGRYPDRVFYTRQWRTPDGKVFGKAGLRVATDTKFRALVAGFRFAFELTETTRKEAV